MNKSFTIILCLSLAIVMLTQNICAQTIEHLSFKGVPMTGTINNYAEQLKTKGFTIKSTAKEGIKMTGAFAGRQNITAIIGPVSEVCSTIKTVTIIINEENSWQALTASFEHYKKFYTLKYGEPNELSEKGTGEDYRSLSDLKKGTCNYMALWSINTGTISMTMKYLSGTCNIVVTYTDAAGASSAEKEILSDI